MTFLALEMEESHITIGGGGGTTPEAGEDRLHRQIGATRAPTVEDRSPGDSPGPPGQDPPKAT